MPEGGLKAGAGAKAFARYSLSHVVRAQLACEDLRCRYYAGVYLLKHLMLSQQDKYWRSLRHVLGTAQQLNGERLVGREGRRQLCRRADCKFAHPEGHGETTTTVTNTSNTAACRFGWNCSRLDCWYAQPDGRAIDSSPQQLQVPHANPTPSPRTIAGVKHEEMVGPAMLALLRERFGQGLQALPPKLGAASTPDECRSSVVLLVPAAAQLAAVVQRLEAVLQELRVEAASEVSEVPLLGSTRCHGPPAGLHEVPLLGSTRAWLLETIEGVRSLMLALQPFAGASPDACRRVADLAVVYQDHRVYAGGLPSVNFPGTVLQGLLCNLPSLRNLEVMGTMARGPATSGLSTFSPQEQVLVSSALASAAHLTSLTLHDWSWLPCIAAGLSARLKTLTIGGSNHAHLPLTCVAPSIAQLTALQRLTMRAGMAFQVTDLVTMLDALQPSVEMCSLQASLHERLQRDTAKISLELANGKLLSCEVCSSAGVAFHPHQVCLLSDALLRSRMLGLRLPRLALDVRLALESSTPPFGAAARELLARCGEVRLYGISAASGCPDEAVLEAARLLGTPATLSYKHSLHEAVCLDLSSTPWRTGQPQRAEGIGAGGSGGVSGSGNGRGGGRPFLPPIQAAHAVLERVVQRMRTTPADPGREATQWQNLSSTLLLTGSRLPELLSSEAALWPWVRAVSEELAPFHPIADSWRRPVCSFRRLPSPGALLLTCSSAAIAEDAAEMVRWIELPAVSAAAGGVKVSLAEYLRCTSFAPPTLTSAELDAQAARGGVAHAAWAHLQQLFSATRTAGVGSHKATGTAGVSSTLLEVVQVPQTMPRLSDIVGQVLQAMWHGDETGGPASEAGGVERLAWLLETIDGVRFLLPDEHRL
ncbi:hypothetical protein HYH03_007243 [Edaphochlamys debaryana]|uniref:Uncharacterized protein n=1 Tax=Edaphochlamys debaryana TaxID=47281 RepID=A0A835Y3W3_9CHLO|nr:hypothetical protein HYH03_007243 [Edaphochlamys debaryana]|eukprot:KAG2494729.1 hypothetical protein HYH03_007243 [Edaphochlamys debaryana]